MRRRGKRPAIRAGEYLGHSLSPEVMKGIRLAGLAEEWVRIAGAPGRRSRPLRMEQNELVVLAETPAVAQQLQMRGGDLCRKIRETWNIQVHAIRPMVGRSRSSPPQRRTADPERKSSVVVGERELREAMDELRGTIGNEDVLMSLARLMVTYRKRFGVRPESKQSPRH